MDTNPEVPDGEWFKGFRFVQDLRPGALGQNLLPSRPSRQGQQALSHRARLSEDAFGQNAPTIARPVR
jgi:hypothetical protein